MLCPKVNQKRVALIASLAMSDKPIMLDLKSCARF